MKLIPIIFVLFFANISVADMLMNNYTPQRTDRFYVGSDKAFIGSMWDFSGIGKTSDGRWVTMISPSIGVTCHHWPANGSVTFYPDNTTNNPIVGTIDSSIELSYSDAQLVHFSSPVVGVKNYTMSALLSGEDYTNKQSWLVGTPFRVGIDTIYAADSLYVKDLSLNCPDGALVQNYDSGGPTFSVMAGGTQISLIGIHKGNGSAFVNNNIYVVSLDSFLPSYISQIKSWARGYNNSINLVSYDLPGDANKDGEVGPEDFGLLKDNFGVSSGATWTMGDFDFDGQIGPEDFGILKDNFGVSVSPAPLYSIPEPTTLSIILVILYIVSARKIRRHTNGI